MPSRETANTTSVLRIMNERAVYEQIRLLGPVSRPQLATATGLSKPTISLALADLERVGLVKATGRRAGGAGRSARLYGIRPETGWVIGLDVGREWIRAALADLSGEIAVREDVRSAGAGPAALIDRIGRIVDDLAKAADGAVTTIVLGTPGVHDVENRRLRLAPNLPGWDAPGVTGRLARRLPAPCTIENDIDLAALGEQGYGLGEGVANFAFMSIGTGIGMGIVLNGELHRGSRGAAGEIAWLPFGEADPREARSHGMLESVASGPGVVAAARRLGMTGPITAKRVFDEARAGDPLAAEAVAHEAGHVARALASVVALLDPDLIVLGGGIGGHGADVLLGAVRDRLETMTPLGAPRVEVSALGDDAVVLGALATGLKTARDLVFTRAVTDP
ncbi:ROK family transcriptional regulator [Actinomadura opuntiae]|uniref:ROK family transcriptional regulator n=1 Tax=Actinomadura sp. OS1-43 TaxID=604315 RepID=UPI00255AB641|nr:ROK family protein [Actinomadura sp. OS1-43]MDL4816157.1 ROK family protein [Actinomadura sp. OS1-43]